MKNRTTSKHFEIFKKEAELWINKIGLKDWRIDFVHRDSPDGKSTRAWFRADIEARAGKIGLALDWAPDQITTSRLRISAFHEVLELLLAPLGWIAECRFAQPEEIPEATHAIIRRFENLFYGNAKPKTKKV